MLDLLQRVLGDLVHDYNVGAFVPILETDIAAYLYHLWISKFGEANKVHLDTRIHQKLGSRFDFVTGKIDYSVGRPCITNPELVVELKAFPFGFTDQQHRVHYFHVIRDDLPKLAYITNPANSRFEILFDEDNYLEGFDVKNNSLRMAHIVKTRDALDRRIEIVLLKKTAKTLEYKFM